jgi:hypothetical protein
MKTLYLLTAAAAVGAMAVPASAQQPYAYPYAQPAPQPYPGQPGYGYAQPGYAQPYGTTANPIEQIVNQLLGNRYNVNDRTAVSRCASAAMTQAQARYRTNYNRNGYDQRYANSGYANAYSQMRVTSITEVQRRSNNGLRVSGLISSGAYAQPYGNAYGYQGQGYADPRYAQAADLSFRCNVAYNGQVTNVRISRNTAAYRR